MQQPNDPAHSLLGSDSLTGIYTFDGRGGLTVDDTITEIYTSASVQNTEAPYTQSVNETSSGQYKVEADGSVTITFGVTGNTLNGPFAGSTFSIDQFVLSVRPSPDNKTLLVTSTEQVVSTLTFNGLMVPFICSDSGTAVRVGL
ncbi:MAG: hypothetical protein JO007_18425 [Alphaproteobacteria bacterium]|nr:hypothetical protein [Alphaproteobacteria bacterium]